MIDISELRSMNQPEKIAITEHARIRLFERGITVNDVMLCIDGGEIIEQYDNDSPLPSCLVVGLSIKGRYIHAVVSKDDEFIYLITAYYPDKERWGLDFKTRRER